MSITYAHTNIIADDWRALAAFYESTLGCIRVPPERHQSGRWLAQGTGVPGASLEGIHLRLPGHGDSGPTLEVYQYHVQADVRDRPAPAANRRGLGHLAFVVDDVDATAAAILAHGGRALGEIVTHDVDGVGRLTFVYMTDPEGNILEIQHWE